MLDIVQNFWKERRQKKIEHQKNYYQKMIMLKDQEIVIEGPVTASNLSTLKLHAGLKAFRPPERQLEALITIAHRPEGRIIIARAEEVIIGYVTFHYPDPFERWAEGNLPNLLELGAIEIAKPYRNGGIAKKLLEVAFLDKEMENYIILTTEYYWHWDLEGSGLTIWEYREVMEKIMTSAGLTWHDTDDPEINAHPANCLMVRIGSKVDRNSIEKFEQIKFKNKILY